MDLGRKKDCYWGSEWFAQPSILPCACVVIIIYIGFRNIL